MPNKYLISLLAGLLLSCSPALCQVLTIGTATMKVPAGATLTVGSLVLQPSATLSLSNNSITGSATPVSVNGVEGIDNVFTFGAAVTYSGTATLFYSNPELNGNTASQLRIAYKGAAGGIYTLNCSGMVDTTLKKVTSSSLIWAHLHTVTSVQSTISIGGIMGAGSVCAGSTIAFTESTAGGVWSSSHPGIANISSTGIVHGISAGTATISYTKSNSCGSASATKIVTVNAAPITPAAITGIRTVCAGSTTDLADATAGGVWGSSNTGIAAVSITGAVHGVSAGTATVIYTKSNSCGSSHATAIVTVRPLPTVAAITGSATVCAGSAITLADASAGGVWSIGTGGGWIAAISSWGALHGISPGIVAISYTKSNSCGSASATKIVTVNAAPTTPAAITGTRTVCAGSTTALSDITAGGVWGSSNTGIAAVSITGAVHGVSAGTATIIYTRSNSCGSSHATAIVTVRPLPTVVAITGSSTVCAGSAITLADASADGVWSVGPGGGWIAAISSWGALHGISPGIVAISYTKSNSCGSASATKIVTVNAAPTTPAAITGIRTVCAGGTTALSDITAGGVWGSSNTGIAAVSITGAVHGISAGTATIIYTVSNSCGSTHATAVVTVNALPTVAAITGGATVCGSSTTTLADATAGGAWSSSNTGIATVVPVAIGTGVVHGCGSGYVTISYTVSNSHGCTAAATKEIEVGKAYAIFALAGAGGSISPAGITSVCAGSSETYAITAAGGYAISGVFVDGFWMGTMSSYTFGPVISNHIIVATFERKGKGKGKGSRTTDAGNDEIPNVIKVYPNPTDGLFTVEIPAIHKNAEIVVTDLSGKIIFTQTVADNTGVPVQVSLGNVASGMYLVKVMADETAYVEKLIVR